MADRARQLVRLNGYPQRPLCRVGDYGRVEVWSSALPPGPLDEHAGRARNNLEDLSSDLIRQAAPELLDQSGVGPDTAAALLISAGDNSDRLTSEAAYAALCGTSSVSASSGKTDRHRLNRHGDRQANAALHRILITRLATHPETRVYMHDRLAPNGANRKHLLRCLMRYLARRLYPIVLRSLNDLHTDRPPSALPARHP